MTANEIETRSGSKDVFGASLSRRGFVKAGGALLVGLRFLGAQTAQTNTGAVGANTLNSALPQSWIEIHADNTILIRVGKPDFGTSSVFTAYRQIAAEELCVPFEAITTIISGDTDRT
ncbi:MAG: molybdopterin cofactor-binding domain-containing protein, partial [Bryobacteraceae bacterium]